MGQGGLGPARRKAKGLPGMEHPGRVPCGPWALCIASQGCRVKVDEKERTQTAVLRRDRILKHLLEYGLGGRECRLLLKGSKQEADLTGFAS